MVVRRTARDPPVILSREDGEESQNATAVACGCGRRILRFFAVSAAQNDGRKNEGPAHAGPSVRLPKRFGDDAYFFFDDDFLLLLPPLDFFDEDEDLELFFAAISAHHLSCRTGPPGRASGHNAPDFSG
jgi:hypothetical protein